MGCSGRNSVMRRRARLSLIVIALGFVVMLVASAGSQATAKSVTDKVLEARAAYDLIQKNKNNANFVVLDVRTPDEFKDGHIEGAININYESGGFKTELAELDMKKTYFVYCRTGRRSGEAVKIMKEMGFDSIVTMKGDIVKWKSEKLPLVR
jgi:rhodanese-related sulfurtransferase